MDNKNQERIIILGAGDLARELLGWIIDDKKYNPKNIFFLDDDKKQSFSVGNLQFKIIGLISNPPPINDNDIVFLAVADPMKRSYVFAKYKKLSIHFSTYIHPTALISSFSKISEGCIIFPKTLVSFEALLEACVILNSYVGVGHNVKIGAHSTISTHVDLTGYVEIGSKTFIGSGARIMPKKKIGENCKIGAGTVIYNNVKDGKTIYVIPPKSI